MTYFFDFDGTLADTEQDIKEAWCKSIDDLNLSCPDFDALYVTGPSIDRMCEILFPDRATDELKMSVRARFTVNYDSNGFPTTRAYPGVTAWLRELVAKGNKIFIASNKRAAALEILIPKLGWSNLFSGIYCPDMQANRRMGKAEFLAMALAQHNLNPTDCTMVGDTYGDVAAAHSNGMRAVAALWGYGPDNELTEADDQLFAPPPLIEVVAAALGIPTMYLNIDTLFSTLPRWSSLTAFSLLVRLENEFGAHLDASTLLATPTLRTILTQSH